MTIPKLSAAVICLGILAAAVTSEVAHAQQAQLSRIARSLSNRGYEATHELTEGWLNDGESATFTVWLDRGTRYTLRGTCDSDCEDLDLVLRGPASFADSDTEPDSIPIVNASPARSGRYTVTVTMANCSSEPCRYIVGVFGR
jgi:hypothetical protein